MNCFKLLKSKSKITVPLIPLSWGECWLSDVEFLDVSSLNITDNDYIVIDY